MTKSPIEIWRKKLKAFQRERAIAADAEQKFLLDERIKEAEAKIAELEGVTPGATSSPCADRDTTVPPATERKRRIDVVVPSTTEPGRPIELFVQVRLASSPPLGIRDWPLEEKPSQLRPTSEPVRLTFLQDTRTGKLQPAELRIAIVTSDCEVMNGCERIVPVPPHEASKKFSFLLKPNRTGRCRINLEVYDGNSVLLGTLPLEPTVGGAKTRETYFLVSLPVEVLVKPIEGSPPGDADSQSPTGGGNETGVIKQSRKDLHLAKLTWGGLMLTLAMVALLWFFYGNQTDKSVRRNVWRYSKDTLSELGRPRSPATIEAKLQRHTARIQQDFAEDPLSILDTLDRGVFVRSNSTSGTWARLHFVIPSTNHFAVLTNLSKPTETSGIAWKISDMPPDPVVGATLENARALKQIAAQEQRRDEDGTLMLELYLPFANLFLQPERANAVLANDPPAPTTNEASAFFDSTIKTLAQVQLLHILGSTSAGPRALFLCELVDPESGSAVLVLFHSTWKPRNSLVFLRGIPTTYNPEDWRTEFEVVMPPSAWDIEGAWSRLK